MMKKSKFVSISQFAAKATGGVYGSSNSTPSLPASTTGTGGSITSAASTHSSGSAPHTPGGGGSGASSRTHARVSWADRVREKLPPLGETEYEVLWERGVLGVIFLESEKDGIPYVSKATESCISPMVSPGDVLKFVNVVRSKDHSFSDFFKILATMKKPVLLRFDRASDASRAEMTTDTLEPSRSNSANDLNGRGIKEAAKALAAKVQRSNSIPPSDNRPSAPAPQPKQPTRGTFWRSSSSKDPQLPSAPSPPTPKLQLRETAPPSRDDDSPDEDLDSENSPREPWDGNDASYENSYDFDVYWETGSLGLFFGEERGSGQPVVTRSTPGVNPSVQRKVDVNDVLLSANGVRSADFTFEAFFARLQQMSKPVKLVFRRKTGVGSDGPSRGRKPSVTVDSGAPLSPVPPFRQAPQPEPAQPLRTSRLPPPMSRNDAENGRRAPAPSPPPVLSTGMVRSVPGVVEAKPKSPTLAETRGFDQERDPPTRGTLTSLKGKSPGERVSTPIALLSPKQPVRNPPPSPPRELVEDPKSVNRSRPDAINISPSSQSIPAPLGKPKTPSEKSPPHATTDTVKKVVSEPPAILVLDEEFESSPRFAMEESYGEEVISGTAVASNDVEVEGEVAVGVVYEENPNANPESTMAEAAVASVIAEETVDDVVNTEELTAEEDASIGALDEVEIGVAVDSEDPDPEDSVEDDEAEMADVPESLEEQELLAETSMLESDDSEPLDSIDQVDPDISPDMDGREMMAGEPKNKVGNSSPSKPSKSTMNANLAKYKKKAKNSRPLVKMPAISEQNAQTVPLAAPNAVNTNVQVRGRTKPKPSLVDTPDSATYLVKWKEGRSVGLQLREVRFAKGTYPLVVDVCKEQCCDSLKHVCIGDVIVEINGRNCSTMGVKKTVNFLKTCSKTMLLKLRHGPAFVTERVSAYL